MSRCLDRFDVFRPRSFGTLPLCERHLMPFVKLINGYAFNAGTVEELVLSVLPQQSTQQVPAAEDVQRQEAVVPIVVLKKSSSCWP